MRICLMLLLLFSVPSYSELTDNLRWSFDASARVNNNTSAKNTSRIYAFGLDTHKVFTSSQGDIGYAVGQLYFTQLSNQNPYPAMFSSEDDGKFVIREAHLNYASNSNWLPNIRLGHFTIPFGIEESIDTNGRLLDYYHGKNLGTKLDWGLGFNKVLQDVQYSISYTLGGKDKPKSIKDSYAFAGRVGSLSHLDFILGFSVFDAKIDETQRQRIALDWQYYWSSWGFIGEIALGKDKPVQQQWRKETYSLVELNKTSIDQQLKLYGQYIFSDREGESEPTQRLNMGTSYQIDKNLELSLSTRIQLNTPTSGKKLNLVRFQLRYRY